VGNTSNEKAGQLPSFSLEPNQYVLGGDFITLDLVNNCQAATEIFLECSWQNFTKKYYIVSLNSSGRARLEGVPVMEITKNGKKIMLRLSCKDARGRPFNPPLFEIDFGKIKSENIHIAYQYNFTNALFDRLDEIRKELKHINDTLKR
jgi:hypothetical protein